MLDDSFWRQGLAAQMRDVSNGSSKVGGEEAEQMHGRSGEDVPRTADGLVRVPAMRVGRTITAGGRSTTNVLVHAKRSPRHRARRPVNGTE